MNIALCSPSNNLYSETFIQAHRERLEGNIFYYYGGEIPTRLEGGIILLSRKKRILEILKGHFRLNQWSLAELALINSFRTNNINIVFAEYGPTGHKLIPICKDLGLPLITHFHGYDASCKEILKSTSNYKQLFNYAKNIIVVSKKMYKDFLLMGCPEHKLIYNVYGPRDEFFEVNPTFAKQQFVAIGRFTDKKAPYYLILSFKEVVRKFPNAKLIIAGDGKLWNTCHNLVKYYGLQGNIELPGIIKKEQYMKYLNQSMAMIQHSITAFNGDSEGTPLAILEAAAAGVPIISTEHAGIPDVIKNGENGFLVKEHDVNGMTKALIRIIEFPNLSEKMGENARAIVKHHFSLQQHIDIHNQLLKETFSMSNN